MNTQKKKRLQFNYMRLRSQSSIFIMMICMCAWALSPPTKDRTNQTKPNYQPTQYEETNRFVFNLVISMHTKPHTVKIDKSFPIRSFVPMKLLTWLNKINWNSNKSDINYEQIMMKNRNEWLIFPVVNTCVCECVAQRRYICIFYTGA